VEGGEGKQENVKEKEKRQPPHLLYYSLLAGGEGANKKR